MSDTLSKRGTPLASSPPRMDMDLWMEAIEDAYHPTDNPQGAFLLNVAENVPASQEVRRQLESIFQKQKLPSWVMQYTSSLGHPEVRQSVAGFMRYYFGSQSINEDTICFGAGAAATLEVLSFVLCDAGDTMVIPAPAYPVYTKDFGIKSGLERFDLQTHTEIKGRSNLALVNVELLEKTRLDLAKAGKNWTLLVLTSPDNPTGCIYGENELTKIAKWCHQHQIHLLVNEIYACSLIDHQHPEITDDYVEPQPFVSFARVMEKLRSPYLHLNWALSKDFGSSGARFGVLHTLNEAALAAIANTNIPHMVSNLTQWSYQQLFDDSSFYRSYIKQLQRELTEAYVLVVRTLREMNIPYSPARGSLFVWADFSAFLSADSAEAEEAFWLRCFRETKILLTPGVGFGHRKYGLFRIVFTAVSRDELAIAMNRLKSLSF